MLPRLGAAAERMVGDQEARAVMKAAATIEPPKQDSFVGGLYANAGIQHDTAQGTTGLDFRLVTVRIRAFPSECLNKTKGLIKRSNVIEVPTRQYRNDSFAHSSTVPTGRSMNAETQLRPLQ